MALEASHRLTYICFIWRRTSGNPLTFGVWSIFQSVVLQGPVGTAEIEEIHYGEIDFSTLRPPSDSVQDSGQDQHAVYAQVKPHKIENGQTQAGDDIYALVKKKWLYVQRCEPSTLF